MFKKAIVIPAEEENKIGLNIAPDNHIEISNIKHNLKINDNQINGKNKGTIIINKTYKKPIIPNCITKAGNCNS